MKGGFRLAFQDVDDPSLDSVHLRMRSMRRTNDRTGHRRESLPGRRIKCEVRRWNGSQIERCGCPPPPPLTHEGATACQPSRDLVIARLRREPAS
jgi:hypothetical protein